MTELTVKALWRHQLILVIVDLTMSTVVEAAVSATKVSVFAVYMEPDVIAVRLKVPMLIGV